MQRYRKKSNKRFMHYEICLVKLWNGQCGTSEPNKLQKFINQLFFPKFCKEPLRATVKPTIKVQVDCDIKTKSNVKEEKQFDNF